MENKIEISGVNKFYGKKQALSDINLTIHQGMFGLLGRNGAGKTTLMKTLAALHKKQDGLLPCAVFQLNRQRKFEGLPGIFHKILICIRR